MLTPNRWTEIAFNVNAGRWEVRLYVANPLPDGTGHYTAQLKDRGWALTCRDAENIGAAMLKGAV